MPSLVEPAAAPPRPTLVLVHGAGHTSLVWQRVQALASHRSLAVDVPGRRDRPADITSVTIDDATESIAGDVLSLGIDDVVIVGHSTGGILLPALAARLHGRVQVRHLVFVAGLCAKDGEAVIDTVRPGARGVTDERLGELRARFRDGMLEPLEGGRTRLVIDDARVAMGIESLNFMTQTVSWAGVPDELPRTFVRCRRDPIQPPDLQVRLADNCAAAAVIDLEAGHTPALDAPADLAAVLDAVATNPETRARRTGRT